MAKFKDAHLGRKLSKRVEQTWGFIWTCIHVLMYVHIGIKVWYQKKDDWLMHVGPHKGTCICGQIWEDGTAEMGVRST